MDGKKSQFLKKFLKNRKKREKIAAIKSVEFFLVWNKAIHVYFLNIYTFTMFKAIFVCQFVHFELRYFWRFTILAILDFQHYPLILKWSPFAWFLSVWLDFFCKWKLITCTFILYVFLESVDFIIMKSDPYFDSELIFKKKSPPLWISGCPG